MGRGWHFGGRLLLPALFLLFLFPYSNAGLKWVFHGDAPIIGTPVIKNGYAYAMSEVGSLFVLDMVSGTQSYPYSLNEPTHIPPVLGSKYLIILSDNGKVEAIDIDAGKRAWQYAGGKTAPAAPAKKTQGISTTGAASSPDKSKATDERGLGALASAAADGGYVFLSYSQKLIALDERTGKELWVRPFDGGGPMDLDPSNIYIAHNGKLSAVARGAGATVWEAPSGEIFGTAPSASGPKGRVFLANTQGQVVSFDSKSGRAQWAYQMRGIAMSTPAEIGNLLVFGTNDGEIVGLDPSSGALRFKTQIGGAVWSKPVGASEDLKSLVVFGANDKAIHAIDAYTGAEVWRYPTSDWAFSGATVDGRDVVFGSQDGKIWALSTSPMCTISSPPNGQAVGEKFELVGQAYATRGIANARLVVAGRELPRISGKTDWTASIDASDVPDGPVEVRCVATDMNGLEETDTAPKLLLVKTLRAPKLSMNITVQPVAEPNEKVLVYIRDLEGSDLKDIGLTVGSGEQVMVKSPYELKVPSSDGAYPLVAKKFGFDPAEGQIVVRTNMMPIIVLAGIVVVGLGIILFVLMRMLKKK